MTRMKKKPSEVSPSSAIRLPRSRKRAGKSNKHVPNDTRQGVIALREDALGVDYQPMSISGFAPRIRGAKIRNSKRWISGIAPPLTGLNFPYINKLGQFTGTTLFKWYGDPRSFIASVISTIANRIVNRALQYNSMRTVVKCTDKIVRAAFYYAISKNSYFWDRILFFTKDLEKNRNLLHKFVLKWVLRTDVHKRFVYGHVCNQTQWLLFRAERPRDKSAIMRRALPLLSFERSESALHKIGGILGDTAKAMSGLMPHVSTKLLA